MDSNIFNETLQKEREGGAVVWMYGLSGAGKSTIAAKVIALLERDGVTNIFLLDGDELRLGLNKDLGFSEKDRNENIRRAAEIAKLLLKAGFVVIVTMITPLASMRDLAREIIGSGNFNEVYIKTDLSICEERDPKGLYKKVRHNEIKNFTGIDSPFQPGLNACLTIDTEKLGIEKSAEEIYYVISKKIGQ